MSQNPYQSSAPPWPPQPQALTGPTPPYVTAPAVALTIVGVIDAVQATYALGRNLLGMNEGRPPPPNIQENPDLMEFYNAMQPYQGVINISFSLLAMLCGVLIVLAGVQMFRRRMYPLCITGAILAAIPCLSYLACCLVGEGVGIWALIILLRQEVKRSFS